MRASWVSSSASAERGMSLANPAAAPKQDVETRKLRRENNWSEYTEASLTGLRQFDAGPLAKVTPNSAMQQNEKKSLRVDDEDGRCYARAACLPDLMRAVDIIRKKRDALEL